MRLVLSFVFLIFIFCGATKFLDADPSQGRGTRILCQGETCKLAVAHFIEQGTSPWINRINKNNLLPTETIFMQTKKPVAYIQSRAKTEVLTEDGSLIPVGKFNLDIPLVQIGNKRNFENKIEFIKNTLSKFDQIFISEISFVRDDLMEVETVFKKNKASYRYRLEIPNPESLQDSTKEGLKKVANFLMEKNIIRKKILVSREKFILLDT